MHSQKRQTLEDIRIEFPVLHRHLKFLYFFVISREKNSLKVLSLEETNIKHQVFFCYSTSLSPFPAPDLSRLSS